MGHEKEEMLRLHQLQFIGKVLSVFTHELNNHLAIIKESAGLMEDTLRFQKSSAKYDIEESLKIIQSIENQIGKTSWISKKLNSFGHRMDKPFSMFSVNESIEELLILLNRLANQKKVIFEKDFQEDIPMACSDPAKLQFIVFCLIERGMNILDRDSSIVLKTVHAGGSIKISIIPKGNFIESGEREICSEEIVEYAVEQLGGSITKNAEDKGITIALPAQGMVSV